MNLKKICKHLIPAIKCIFDFRKEPLRFPWRNLRTQKVSPWHVSIGEILLNKVNTNRVLIIYYKLLSTYPTPCELANASPDKIEHMLKPLGLQHKKTLTLIEVSRLLCEEKDIEILKQKLKKVKGIGKNTYNAILLFGFDEPRPLMDGVIGRVLKRIFGFNWKKRFYEDKNAWNFSEQLLKCSIKNGFDPKIFYYNLLDIGREICLHRKPLCKQCSCNAICKYYKSKEKLSQASF
ncbi:MAG: hypothetical protein D6767_05145 [Candidatus Hydrogenedentota bacterium]|nr:MAG: hypothetical protein D6767_05145 [Candidatus Hydrogenedentota bacterium]